MLLLLLLLPWLMGCSWSIVSIAPTALLLLLVRMWSVSLIGV